MIDCPHKKEIMQEFEELLKIAAHLHHPTKGCPWDLSQTLKSMQAYILEETHEVLEAIDEGENSQILEELGDLLYTVIFCAKIGEKENRFTLKEILKALSEKLIRRHPHIFQQSDKISVEEVMQKWEDIKKNEKKTKVSKAFPPTLPSLQRASKLVSKMKKKISFSVPSNREEELAQEVFDLVVKAQDEKIDIESAFRKFLSKKEREVFPPDESLQSTPS